ncbi:TonB-dependent receptor plug domain-containing protein [Qipengyuania thermophila]|uniref:TonB-dependent receptor plug domain-containing protein n=1 Tax=Qipengyuania thermophila TaxID=2509361 RepID=UPI0013ECAE82|nr:TonB-dependent receptor [Qipengyuania thermophila]
MSRFPLFALPLVLAPGAALAQQSDAGDAALEELLRRQDAAAETPPPAPPASFPASRQAAESPVITVTARGLPSTLASSGQAVTVLERDEIDAVQGADIVRVLRRVPAVTASRSGPVGAFTSLSVRGAPGDQLLVLVDGVPVRDVAAPAGGFDFGTLVPGTIGRIELLRGANSVIWGSSAMAGVMEITTRTGPGLSASAEYGSRDTALVQARAGLQTGSLSAGVAGSWARSDGFSAAAAGTEPDGFSQRAVAGTATLELSPTLELFAQGRLARGRLGIDGFPAPAFTLADTDEVQRTTQRSGTIGASHYGTDLTVQVSYAAAHTGRVNRAGQADSATLFASTGESDRLLLRGEYRLIGGLGLAFGAEREWSRYRTQFDAGARTAITGAYVQAGWVLGALAAHAGVRLDDHRRFGRAWSFGGDVAYRLSPDWRVRASAGEGFKAPTLFQLFSAFGNPALLPERSTSYDLALEHGRADGPFFASAGVWRRDAADLITFASCTSFDPPLCATRPFGSYRNTARTRAQGVELQLQARPAAALSLGAVYAFTDAVERPDGAPDRTPRLARQPRHALTAFADWTAPGGLTFSGDVRLVGDSFDDARNAVRLDGYALVDLRASLPLTGTVELFGRVENLFDAANVTVAGYNGTPRGVFAGVRLRR